MIIDSHAHYCHRRFDNTFPYLTLQDGVYSTAEGDRESLLRHMEEAGILCAIEPGISLDSNGKILELCQIYSGKLFPAIGVHPTRTIAEKWHRRKELDQLAALPTVVAIGETGLDYHFPRKEQHRLRQMLWFCYQLELAHRRKLPLILHIRDAHKDALRILHLFRKKLHGGVVHCFTGDTETAKAYVELGFHLGIGGSLLQDKPYTADLPEAVRTTPLSRLLVETDAPYVHPDCKPHVTGKLLRRTRNSSLILPRVIETIAHLKEISPEEVAQATSQNAIGLFRLSFK